MNAVYNLRDSERFSRFIVGFCLVISILVFPLTAQWIALICLIAVYPLFTALIAIDPLLLLIDYVLTRTANYSRLTSGRPGLI